LIAGNAILRHAHDERGGRVSARWRKNVQIGATAGKPFHPPTPTCDASVRSGDAATLDTGA